MDYEIEEKRARLTILAGIIIIAFLCFLFGFPVYNVWASEQNGRAELAQAEYSKQVAVQTSLAKAQAAQYEAEAEVTRAGGVAKANQIIGDSLKGNEVYLRYLWINGLNEKQGDKLVVYVPTEANLPIVEAGRLGQEAK